MTRELLKEHSGLSLAFLYRVEKAKRHPSRESLFKIACALGVSVEELNQLAKARFSRQEMQVLQLLTELENLSETPGFEKAIERAVSALNRPFQRKNRKGDST